MEDWEDLAVAAGVVAASVPLVRAYEGVGSLIAIVAGEVVLAAALVHQMRRALARLSDAAPASSE